MTQKIWVRKHREMMKLSVNTLKSISNWVKIYQFNTHKGNYEKLIVELGMNCCRYIQVIMKNINRPYKIQIQEWGELFNNTFSKDVNNIS